MNFKIGDTVECTTSNVVNLTNGKKYKISNIDINTVCVKNDYGLWDWYPPFCFKPIFIEKQPLLTIPPMTRKQMAEDITRILIDIEKLFTYKNGNYGDSDDAFYNFRTTSLRVKGDDTYNNMYEVLCTYMDKHLCALAKNKMDDKEFIERCKDVIVYNLISIIMKKQLDSSVQNYK